MNNWQAIIVVLAAIILLPFAVVLIVSLIPFLGIIGFTLAALAVTWCISLLVYGVALAQHKIAMMRIREQQAYFSRRYIVAGHVVAFHQEDGEVRNLSAERLLPMPLEEEHQDLSTEDKDIIDRSRVLTAHFEEGKGMHAIEKELGISYNKVRDWCNTAKALRNQQHNW
jgi:hypothetical protein